jgi:hypothetical protein
VEIARRAGAWLLVDEVYAGLEWDAPRAPSVAGLYERGITTGSVSKALGLQGLRTGWLVCRDPGLVMDAVVLRENSSEIMNILGEHLAEIALRPERLGPAMDRARAQGRANLDRLDRFVADTPGLSWHPAPRRPHRPRPPPRRPRRRGPSPAASSRLPSAPSSSPARPTASPVTSASASAAAAAPTWSSASNASRASWPR